MSESRGLETAIVGVLCVALGAGGMWMYRDKTDAQAQVAVKDQTIININSATDLLRKQLPNITRTVDKLGAINVEYRANADVIKSLASCLVPDELRRLSDESMAEINANAGADSADSAETKNRVQGK